MTGTVDFTGQVAIVTGSGRGLGEAYARLLADLGAAVVVHDAGVDPQGVGVDSSVAEAVAQSIRAAGGQARSSAVDLLNPGACEDLIAQAVDRFGRLDVLVHNAGVVRWEDPAHPEDEIWEQTMAVNADAGFRLVRAALPHMRSQDYGRIVLTVSGRAARLEDAAPGLVAYSAAKMAVYGLMVGFGASVREHDIHLNAISPVAAARILVRDAPELTTISVAPGVAVLASRAMTSSGSVLAAAGGSFALERWDDGPAVELGPAPTPDEVLEAWGRMAQEDA